MKLSEQMREVAVEEMNQPCDLLLTFAADVLDRIEAAWKDYPGRQSESEEWRRWVDEMEDAIKALESD